jgi:hypothetical protein
MSNYILLQPLLGHISGERITYINDIYMWETGDPFPLPKDTVENNNEWFIKEPEGWSEGESIFYISLNGVIYEDSYHPLKHSMMINWGNGFKSIEEAEHVKVWVQVIMREKGVNKLETELIASINAFIWNETDLNKEQKEDLTKKIHRKFYGL